MTDPVSNDPVASDSPEHPGGDRSGAVERSDSSGDSSGSSSGVDATAPAAAPAAEQLDDVDDDTAQQHAGELGDDVAQKDDHPYDKAADPDGEPKVITGSAAPAESGQTYGTPGTISTDAERGWTPTNS